MAYWCNHGKTSKTAIEDGYIWSPFTNKNGRTNQGYLNLNRAALNEVIFSYADLKIAAVGVVSKRAVKRYEPRT